MPSRVRRCCSSRSTRPTTADADTLAAARASPAGSPPTPVARPWPRPASARPTAQPLNEGHRRRPGPARCRLPVPFAAAADLHLWQVMSQPSSVLAVFDASGSMDFMAGNRVADAARRQRGEDGAAGLPRPGPDRPVGLLDRPGRPGPGLARAGADAPPRRRGRRRAAARPARRQGRGDARAHQRRHRASTTPRSRRTARPCRTTTRPTPTR